MIEKRREEKRKEEKRKEEKREKEKRREKKRKNGIVETRRNKTSSGEDGHKIEKKIISILHRSFY